MVAGNLARSRQRPRVLLIEGGGDNKRPELRVASERFSNVSKNPEVRWRYETTPQRHLGGRVLEYLRGRGLGGSSIANFEAYIRGARSDYDEWASMVGDDFFAWTNAVERFKELENLHFDDDGDADQYVKLEEDAHGFSGPLDISVQARKNWHLGQDKLMQAAIDFGWPVCRDQNSGNPIGAGCVTTTTYKGYRTTSASAYLDNPPINLDIWCGSTATRILLDTQHGGKPKATGVQLADGRKAWAEKEVILSGGAIETPKLLLLSGIGPKTELRHVGIDCVVDQPEIGKNLIDHVWTTVHFAVSAEISDQAAYEADEAGARAAREEWMRSRTGPDAHRNLPNLIAFLKFNPERADLSELERLPDRVKTWIKKPDVPQIEIFLKALCPAGWNLSHEDEFMGLTIMLMNPQSRGEVTLASKNPAAKPILDPAYLSHPYDRQTIIDGVREALAYVRSTFLSNYVCRETQVPKSDRDEDILAFCQQTINSVLHGCGTVRMGNKGDGTAPLDTHFRLRGVENLRVMDLSATPLITRYVSVVMSFATPTALKLTPMFLTAITP